MFSHPNKLFHRNFNRLGVLQNNYYMVIVYTIILYKQYMFIQIGIIPQYQFVQI